jgi:hypothetical protein
MSYGLLYWILMILWFIFGFVAFYPGPAQPGANPFNRFGPLGSHVLVFVLFLLVGLKIFGGIHE